MKSNQKYITLITVLILFTFVISSCSSPTSGDNDLTNTYDLRLDAVGNGGIIVDTVDSDDPIFVSSERIFRPNRYSSLDITAIPHLDNDFLFWVGDYTELEQNVEQEIYMNRNKELIAVFGDPLTYYMAGNIKEAWGHEDVMGYWRVIVNNQYNEDLNEQFNNGTIDLYARETTDNQRKTIEIFDDTIEQGEDGLSLGEIAYVRPQEVSSSNVADYEYIAAIMRIEETVDQELFLFVFSNNVEIEILLWEDTPTSIGIYEETLDEYYISDAAFKDKVMEVINENKNNDNTEYLLGDTIRVNDPPIGDETQ